MDVMINAIIWETFLPKKRIIVESKYCAGLTKEGQEEALKAIGRCHSEVI